MNFKKFLDADGKLDCIVNLDAVLAAKPTKDGHMVLSFGTETIEVDGQQFEKAIAEKNDVVEKLCQSTNRLILALDRLGVRIPSSIRMHM